MIRISKRTLDRIREGLKKYQKVVGTLRERDVSEADTVTVIKDILADVFGYDKYFELTGEQQIRGTYCDLAVKIENKIKYLIEVKAAGVELNHNHIRQAVDYGAKEGIEWVVLSNGIDWRLYRIKFAQPIEHEEVASFNLQNVDLRKEDDQRKVFLLTREALSDGAMDSYHQQSQLLNRYTIAQFVKHDAVLGAIRREFRRLFPEIKVEKDEIAVLLDEEILKREVIESDKATDAGKRIKKATRKLERNDAKKRAGKAEPKATEEVESNIEQTQEVSEASSTDS